MTFRLGPANVIYADNAEGTRSRWLAVSNWTVRWDTTDEQAHSGRLSFSESPNTVYANGLVSTFALDSALVLNGTAGELRFWLKGRSEDDYDCLRAEISTNRGGTWIPLAGRYTSPGSGVPMEQPFESPVLDGYKYEWVEEVMDLSEYVGKTIQIRFRFTSDNATVYDGFYIDDISVLTYGNLAFHDFTLLNPYVRPGIDTLVVTSILDNPAKHDISAQVRVSNAAGTLLDSVLMMNDGLHSDGLPGDNVWGSHLRAPSTEDFYTLDQTVWNHTIGSMFRLPALMFFTTAGPIICVGDTSSKKPVWGESVIFKFKVRHTGKTALVNAVKGQIRSLDTVAAIAFGALFDFGDFSPGQERLSSYARISFSQWSAGKRDIPFEISFSTTSFEYWRDTILITVDNPTGVARRETIPLKFALEQNYPNPFNPTTTIEYQIPSQSLVTLKVYDLLGREVAMLVNERKDAGRYSVQWNATALSSGIYFYRLEANGKRDIKKMSMIK